MTTRIEVDLDALRHNVRTLAAIAAPARTMLAVKADGYGHGAIAVAQTWYSDIATATAPASHRAAVFRLLLPTRGCRRVFARRRSHRADFLVELHRARV
mgnify:CR=1 FL=1